MRSNATISIERGIEDVFRLATEHIPQWSKVVVEDEVVEDVGGGDVGTTFHSVTEDRGRRMEFVGIVTKHDFPHSHGSKLTGRSFDIDVEYTFIESGGVTEVTHNSEVRGKGVLGVFFLLCGWMFRGASCRALQDEMESLKTYCESDAVSA